MSLKKKQAFNQRMSKVKYPRHQNLAKGGMVKHFDGGGSVMDNTTFRQQNPSMGVQPGGLNSPGTQGSLASSGNFIGGLSTNPIGTVGNAGQNIAADFTAQNQYQAALAPTQQYDYGNVIGGAAGNALAANGTTQNILAQEQGLTNQLQGVANGTGPNPAMAALNQQTGQNVANQGALMAGQRGASSNVGLLAREAAQQGAATQQQAVGQGATLQAQQQLNALGAIGQQQQNMANTNINQQNANTSLFGTGASANNAQNNTNVSNYGMAQGINSGVAQSNANATNQTLSGLTSSAGGALSALLSKGGEVGYDGGGLISAPQPMAEPEAPEFKTPKLEANPPPDKGKGIGSMIPGMAQTAKAGSQNKSNSGQLDTAMSKYQMPNMGSEYQAPPPSLGLDSGASSANAFSLGFANGGSVHPSHPDYFHHYFSSGGMSGGEVDAVVSPKEVYLDPHQVKEVMERGADPMKIGHHFPGKDRVGKDSRKNDVIPTKLRAGGVVLPIHITTHKDASNRGRKFIEKTVAKHMKRPSGA